MAAVVRATSDAKGKAMATNTRCRDRWDWELLGVCPVLGGVERSFSSQRGFPVKWTVDIVDKANSEIIWRLANVLECAVLVVSVEDREHASLEAETQQQREIGSIGSEYSSRRIYLDRGGRREGQRFRRECSM